MATERTVKPLKYASLPGLSERQLKEHHDVLYAGYVKKVNEIRQKLPQVDKSLANTTYSELRELKMEETFALNGAKLHEAYFDNMGGTAKPADAILTLIKEDFGSYENWEAEFRALGLCARGWVILAFDIDEGRVVNHTGDAHNQGGIWNAIPLLAMDVYEHAYFLDYATQRKAYIEAFMKTIDWKSVNAIIEQYHVLTFRKDAKQAK